MNATTVGIDLAKDVFELAFCDANGQVVERKRLSRKAFARTLEQRAPLRVVMEACGSAHYWGRRFAAQGHTVRLLPARDVRPYVRRNKTDRTDVAGILEADRCADIASVPLKTPELCTQRSGASRATVGPGSELTLSSMSEPRLQSLLTKLRSSCTKCLSFARDA